MIKPEATITVAPTAQLAPYMRPHSFTQSGPNTPINEVAADGGCKHPVSIIATTEADAAIAPPAGLITGYAQISLYVDAPTVADTK